MKTIIMFASNKKEAIRFIEQEYKQYTYVGLYRHIGKGNNFYEFKVQA